MKQFIQTQLLKADLVEVDRQLRDSGFKDMASMLLVKQALLAIANLVDLETTVRPLYKEHQELSAAYKKAAKEFEFAKYLRNKFVGHVKVELIEKAIEWKPELRYSLKKVDDRDMMFIFNLFVLETAINTYVHTDGAHKLFDSETDLSHSPSLERFLIFLTFVVQSGINYLAQLSEAIGKNVEMLDSSEQNLEHWLSAGQTVFEFIRK